MAAERVDYSFPFRLDGTSHRAAQTSYATHVEQMIAQVLLTTPGERADLPQFGCGLRQLLFAPLGDPLIATLRIQVTQALGQWLAGVIDVTTVGVTADEAATPGTLEVTVAYTLIESQTDHQTTVTLL